MPFYFFMLYAPFTLSITFHDIFIFAHLSIFLFLLIHLIININHKTFNDTWTIWLLSLALWSMGLFLNLGLKSLTYLGDLVTLIEILSGVHGVYLKTLGCLFVCVHVIMIRLFVCNLEFTRI